MGDDQLPSLALERVTTEDCDAHTRPSRRGNNNTWEAYDHGLNPNLKFKHPVNFDIVSTSRSGGAVYRSGFPEEENYTFLLHMGFKTIITLVDDEPYPDTYIPFLEAHGIRHEILPLPGKDRMKELSMAGKTPVAEINAVIRALVDSSRYPILIHCNKGKHRTGTVVGCFRKVQGWKLPDVLAEYKKYAGAKSRQVDIDNLTGYNGRQLRKMAEERGWTSPDCEEEDGQVVGSGDVDEEEETQGSDELNDIPTADRETNNPNTKSPRRWSDDNLPVVDFTLKLPTTRPTGKRKRPRTTTLTRVCTFPMLGSLYHKSPSVFEFDFAFPSPCGEKVSVFC